MINLFDLSPADLAGMIVSFTLTFMVLSYIFFGDNPAFRFAIHIFIGAASGYVLVVAFYNIIWPQLIVPLLPQNWTNPVLMLGLVILAFLLLTKSSYRLGWLGGVSMAFLVGVGAATAVGGAVLGTLFPQALASANLMDRQAAGSLPILLQNGLILVGTVATLAYFQFSARPTSEGGTRRSLLTGSLATAGKAFIAIAFGSLFAGVFMASLAAMIERLNFIIEFLIPVIFPQ